MTIERIAPGDAAILVGAAPGFGAALVRALAAAGYSVAGIARTDNHGESLAEEAAAAGGEYRHYVCDATDGAKFQAVVRDVGETQGSPRALIYNPMKLVAKRARIRARRPTWRS
jgi:NAD(P)-dependent dehydrogenase (short-subunit alcohol dehydrogenase family)